MRPFAVVACALALSVACEGFVNTDIGRGIGTRCRDDDDCQASQCINGTCTIECAAAEDCPSPTACTEVGVCEVPLYAGFVLVGDFDQEQWSASHELGRQAVEPLSYLTTDVRDGNDTPGAVIAAADELIGLGNQVIVVNRSTMMPTVIQRAEQSPDLRFWVTGYPAAGGMPSNVTAYDGRMYQAYYLAGIAAARYLEQNPALPPKLGIIGSYVTPYVVAMVNAFHLGARSVNEAIMTEIRWIGDWHDPQDPVEGVSLETRLTQELLDSGAWVIAHTADNNIPVLAAAELGGANVYAIGANLANACEAAPGATIQPRCLGVAHYNWGVLYRRMFDTVHSGQSLGPQVLEGIEANPNDSVIQFSVVGGPNQQAVASEIDSIRLEIASESRSVFAGPIDSTGQCGTQDPVSEKYPCIPEGEGVGGEGLQTMCWLVDGIVEGIDETKVPPEIPALVPAVGDCVPAVE